MHTEQVRMRSFTEPFRHWLVEDVVPANLIAACAQTVPAATHPSWVRYWNDCESRKWTMNDERALGPAWFDLFSRLTAQTWVALWSAHVGTLLKADQKYWGGGLHVTFGGGELRPHLDYALHPSKLERRLNLVLYLTSHQTGAGGETILCGSEGQVIKAIEPRCGQALLWEASDRSYHGTARLAPDAPPRLTAAVHYLAEPRPNTTRRKALFLPARV